MKNQTDFLNSVLGVSPTLGVRLEQANSRQGNKARNQFLPTVELDGDNRALDPVVLKDLEKSNYYDILLYEYAQKLAASRISAFLLKKGEEDVASGREGIVVPSFPTRPCKPAINDIYWKGTRRRTISDNEKMYRYLWSPPYCI